MASKIKTKAVPLPLSDFEKRLAQFFFVAAGLSFASVLWNFAPSFRIATFFNATIDLPNGFISAFGDYYYLANPAQLISILAIGVSGLLALDFALHTITGNKLKNRGLIVVASLVLDLGALVLQYLGYLAFSEVNFLDALEQNATISWGFILVAAFALTSMFIKWFFVNRLEAPKE